MSFHKSYLEKKTVSNYNMILLWEKAEIYNFHKSYLDTKKKVSNFDMIQERLDDSTFQYIENFKRAVSTIMTELRLHDLTLSELQKRLWCTIFCQSHENLLARILRRWRVYTSPDLRRAAAALKSLLPSIHPLRPDGPQKYRPAKSTGIESVAYTYR
jgi:hypothetical protein